MQRARSSKVSYARSPDLEGLEAGLLENFTGSRTYYARREFVFAFSDPAGGAREYEYRGETIKVPAGKLVIVQAGEPYKVRVSRSSDIHWLHLDLSLFRKVAGLEEGRIARLPYFPELVVDDAQLLKSVQKLHKAVMYNAPLDERKKLLESVIDRAISKHTAPRPNTRKGARKPEMQKARDYMQESLERTVPLKELADMTGMSVFQFVRAFAKDIGLTPHAMLIQMRAQRAREMLKKGASATEASTASGFSDPSHLVRHFKRIFKITPGAYAAAGNGNGGKRDALA